MSGLKGFITNINPAINDWGNQKCEGSEKKAKHGSIYCSLNMIKSKRRWIGSWRCYLMLSIIVSNQWII